MSSQRRCERGTNSQVALLLYKKRKFSLRQNTDKEENAQDTKNELFSFGIESEWVRGYFQRIENKTIGRLKSPKPKKWKFGNSFLRAHSRAS